MLRIKICPAVWTITELKYKLQEQTAISLAQSAVLTKTTPVCQVCQRSSITHHWVQAYRTGFIETLQIRTRGHKLTYLLTLDHHGWTIMSAMLCWKSTITSTL